ncbi:RNA-binding protein 8A [Tieghemiomyces parasiticus]|uniref:RNA-binding protein 8A n=1 Tax=Tieghemiomyces parasiticus TaxID=78921 RepID=A0A9W8AB27_9FUNG|nr:RNA-binding protein 8A [Tieghemiomyces parasiticus]
MDEKFEVAEVLPPTSAESEMQVDELEETPRAQPPQEEPEDVKETRPRPAVRSVVKKGRGFLSRADATTMDPADESTADTMEQDTTTVGQYERSVEGWVIIVTGLHEEATEEDVTDKFADYGRIKDFQMNLDRRTGYVKGYALIEYEEYKEAEAAVADTNGTEYLGRPLRSEFAFLEGKSSSYTQVTSRRR